MCSGTFNSPTLGRKGFRAIGPINEPSKAFDADGVSGNQVGLAGVLGVLEAQLGTGQLDAPACLGVASGQGFPAVDIGHATWGQFHEKKVQKEPPPGGISLNSY